MVENMYYDMIPKLPSIVGNVGCLALCAGSLPKYDRLTIGLTNMYYKWAIKLFGNYKKSMMIRNVCWMCYKSDRKFMIKYFIVYLKIRLLNYVHVPYYALLLLYERKMKYFHLKARKLS